MLLSPPEQLRSESERLVRKVPQHAVTATVEQAVAVIKAAAYEGMYKISVFAVLDVRDDLTSRS